MQGSSKRTSSRLSCSMAAVCTQPFILQLLRAVSFPVVAAFAAEALPPQLVRTARQGAELRADTCAATE